MFSVGAKRLGGLGHQHTHFRPVPFRKGGGSCRGSRDSDISSNPRDSGSGQNRQPLRQVSRVLLVLSLSLALFFGGVVDASAAEGSPSLGLLMDESTATIGPLKASLLNADARSFLREWQNDSSDWIIFFYANGGSNCLVFAKLPTPASTYYSVTSSSYHLIKNISSRFLVFDLDTGNPIYPDIRSGSYSTSSYYPPFDFVQYRYFMQAGLTSAYPNIWKPVKESPTGAFTVLLDDEEPPTPSEPDPPTPSKPDPPPPVSYPDFPVVGPADNQYIPYDVTVWNQFADHIKKTLGALVPVCLICLSIILGIRVVVKLVNHFAK